MTRFGRGRSRRPHIAAALSLPLTLLGFFLAGPGAADTVKTDQKVSREEGEFRIQVDGQGIGTERYEISASGDAVVSTSVVEFRNPGDTRQRVRLETHLEMNARYVPTNYRLKTDVDGRKGTISGSFAPNQVILEYLGGGTPRKEGILTGNQFTILDTNVFHHFVFLARLFKYDEGGKVQRFEVVIPQETDSGALKGSQVGQEPLVVRGKKVQTRHLHLDSGSLQIEMWVDHRLVVQKITVPSKGIEIVRD